MLRAVFILHLLLLFFTGPRLFAQAPAINWEKCFGGPHDEQVNSIEPTSDGGYIIAGYTFGNGGDVSGAHNANSADFWVVKLSSTGGIEWSRCLGGSMDDMAQVVHQTPDGGYIVGGWSNSTDGDLTGSHGGIDSWLVKLDGTGAIQWQKSYGTSGNESMYDLKLTPDGGYILAGTTDNTGDLTGLHTGADAWIVKVDGSGNLQWQKYLGGSDNDIAWSIIVLTDGSYVMGGYTKSNNGDVSGNHGGDDYWVVKLSAAGSLVWQKCLGGSNYDDGFAVQPGANGGIMIAGTSPSTDGDVTGSGFGMWVVSLNSAGVLLWQKKYNGFYGANAYAMDRTSDGGYLVAGAKAAHGDVPCGVDGTQYYWVIRIDASGTLLWEKSLGGSASQIAYAVHSTPDGGAIVAGGSSSADLPGFHAYPPGNVTQDAFVVKLSDKPPVVVTPVITIDPLPAGLCSGTPVTIHVTTNLSTISAYQWTRNGLNVGTNSADYTVSDLADGDQVACAITTLGTCDLPVVLNSNTVVVNVSPLVRPSIQITADASVICAGSLVSFEAAVGNGHGAPFYQWQVNGQNAGGNSDRFAVASLHNGDVVSCTYSDNTACTAPGPNVSNTIPITVDPVVPVSVSIVASKTAICSGSPVDLTAQPVDGGTTPIYQWQLNGIPVGTNSPAYSGSNFSDGDIIVCQMTSSTVCSSPVPAVSNAVKLTVTPIQVPSVRIDYQPAVLCAGDPVTLTAAVSKGGSAPVCQWQLNGVNIGENNLVYTIDRPSDGDMVGFSLSNPAACVLPSSDQVTLAVHPKPGVGPGRSLTLSKGQSVVLDLAATGNISTYAWSPSAGLSDPAIADPLATPMRSTDYRLEVVSEDGCSASGDVQVNVISTLAVPGAFSPNGDGHNDIFYVLGGPLGAVIKDFAVFDRTGRCVFQVHGVAPDDPAFGWDGRVAGQPVAPGTYVYEVLISFADKTQQVFKGTVVLVR